MENVGELIVVGCSVFVDEVDEVFDEGVVGIGVV